MNEQQLSSFSPEEWTFVEVIYPNKLPQIRVFVEDGWKTPEEAAKIAEKRRSFGTFPKYVRSSILADYRICPICLITSKTDSEFIQHLLVELSKEIDALKVEANRKPKSVVWYDKDSNAQTVPQLTLAELDKIPKEIIKEGAIVCVPETAFSDKFFRIFQKGEWQVATNEEVLKSWKPEYKESPPMHSP